MQLKQFLLFAAFTAISCAGYAQDKIYKKDGDEIEAKIKTIGLRTITYLRADNLSGPEYTIAKKEVEKIVYENGNEDKFDEQRGGHHKPDTENGDDQPKTKEVHRPNILSIAPFQFTENGVGIGLFYERAIDKDGIISFYLPIAATVNVSAGSEYNSGAGTLQNRHEDAMYYAMPGIKVYPTGAFGKVRYSVGPSLVIGAGEKTNDLYSSSYPPYSSYNPPITQSHYEFGMMINNSLNINATAKLYMGLELGLGFTYFNQVGGINQGTDMLAQGGFKIGYRF